MKKYINKLLGDPNQKVIKTINPIVKQINDLEEKMSGMSDEELKEMTTKLRERLGEQKGKKKDADIEKKMEEILPEAFATIREASKRTIGLRHFDVQLIGGIILHRGKIAEMKTGEGKTLVATLPMYLNALSGRGVHLVTVNDYLARVGAGWMAQIYHFLGLSIGVITSDGSYIYDPEFVDESQYDHRLSHLKQVSRKEAYACDVVYGTNNEFGFDYLRDNMVSKLDDRVQRDLGFAIIDEIDSILIDEARTPLIISAPAEQSTDRYYKFADLVKRLQPETDYNVDEKMRAVTLTEEGISKMEKWLGMGNIYVEKGIREVHHIEQALKAHVLFKKEKDYVVKEGEVIIVDEFTGRLMPGRRYSEGLHQAIEAKEGAEIKRESQTLATITFQNFFRMYDKITGMTGTAATEAEEFLKIYNLETVVIPTHKPMVRNDLNDLIYRTEEGKFKAVIRDVKERNEKGQPVLIGTASIEKNELLANMMEKEGLEPQVLNAKNHEKEAKIISQAGRSGAITIATNMAGRGVDIILGGDPPEEKEQKKVRENGGLHVLGTERHEARRIDNQLRGRAGRQGDPGSSQFYVSAEDDLMRIFGGERMKKIMNTLKVPEDVPIENKVISRSIESAQKKVEGNNFDVRKHLVEYDDVINKHRENIYTRRKEILEIAEGEREDKERTLSDIVMEMVENEIEQVVSFHTSAEKVKEWNLDEIYQVASTIFPVREKLKEDLSEIVSGDTKLDKAKVRTKIIEHLVSLAHENYEEIKKRVDEYGVDWKEVEKQVLIRAIDTLWVDHLEAMNHMRQGIGLRGYGQRDPLIEYKREAHRMFHELNGAIQRQVVYSVYKIGAFQNQEQEGQFSAPTLSERAQQFSAPAKTMNGNSSSSTTSTYAKAKVKNEDGEKVGRNDPCPCGSGKKYKKCCGK